MEKMTFKNIKKKQKTRQQQLQTSNLHDVFVTDYEKNNNPMNNVIYTHASL